MAKINGSEVDTLVIKNALSDVLGTLSVTDSGGGISTGTFTISAEDASTYATSEYTVDDITCQNGYVIVAQRQSGNGMFYFVHTPIISLSGYKNGNNISGGGTSNNAKLVEGHPVIKAINASFPLVADTYDIIYW